MLNLEYMQYSNNVKKDNFCLQGGDRNTFP